MTRCCHLKEIACSRSCWSGNSLSCIKSQSRISYVEISKEKKISFKLVFIVGNCFRDCQQLITEWSWPIICKPSYAKVCSLFHSSVAKWQRVKFLFPRCNRWSLFPAIELPLAIISKRALINRALQAPNFSLQYHCLIKHAAHENNKTDHQRQNALMPKQTVPTNVPTDIISYHIISYHITS